METASGVYLDTSRKRRRSSAGFFCFSKNKSEREVDLPVYPLSGALVSWLHLKRRRWFSLDVWPRRCRCPSRFGFKPFMCSTCHLLGPTVQAGLMVVKGDSAFSWLYMTATNKKESSGRRGTTRSRSAVGGFCFTTLTSKWSVKLFLPVTCTPVRRCFGGR